jgi:hypothetical protein
MHSGPSHSDHSVTLASPDCLSLPVQQVLSVLACMWLVAKSGMMKRFSLDEAVS